MRSDRYSATTGAAGGPRHAPAGTQAPAAVPPAAWRCANTRLYRDQLDGEGRPIRIVYGQIEECRSAELVAVWMLRELRAWTLPRTVRLPLVPGSTATTMDRDTQTRIWHETLRDARAGVQIRRTAAERDIVIELIADPVWPQPRPADPPGHAQT